MYNIEDINQFKNMCSNISILMLDDEVMITDSYRDVASRFYNNVAISNNPKEVLENYEVGKYDIIYTDLNMPQMNGVDLIHAIKQIDHKQKFIIISASDESDKLLELLSLNISAFLVKPFNLNRFIEVSIEQVSIILQSRLMKKETLELQKELKDITKEKKEQEMMLIQQSKLAQTGEMISMIAHQWRQPLSSMTTLIAGLRTRLELGIYEKQDNPFEVISSDLYKAFDKMEASATFLSKTINDFRNFYRPSNEKNRFNIYEAISSVFAMLNLHSSIRVNITCSSKEESNVETFEGELKQVFMSIINNAVDALVEKKISNPNILVSILIEEEKILISIADNAGGIPGTIIDNIFLPYFSTKSKKNGTGLGLHMAKTIIEEHIKGTLKVENSNDSQGAEFIISIPKYTDKDI
ncbi:MAG: two-component system NtrC family sensor kinase [Sulfurimonas sp.]|jgi:two-component system NtrC family sensor kinase|uniref:sensor histidine kinase n=1 Tax=Sulfurimonas sp. TaxID=2022749 RepID=UPI0039E69E76